MKAIGECDVISGVSDSKIKTNLATLGAIASFLENTPAPSADEFKNSKTEQKANQFLAVYFFANILLAWFWAMGIEVSTIESWLGRRDIQQIMSRLEDALKKGPESSVYEYS